MLELPLVLVRSVTTLLSSHRQDSRSLGFILCCPIPIGYGVEQTVTCHIAPSRRFVRYPSLSGGYAEAKHDSLLKLSPQGCASSFLCVRFIVIAAFRERFPPILLYILKNLYYNILNVTARMNARLKGCE